MVERQTELYNQIESAVGPDHVTNNPQIKVGDLRPAIHVNPGSTGEVRRCLEICGSAGRTVIPAGKASWLECGNPVRSADVVLSLERMNRIIDYSPSDLTATVEAGLTLDEFNSVARRERQWLPFDPPGRSSASLGAVAACNSTGALRFGFGMPRDYVLGLRLAHADGTESKSGGRVVKNVAGYDLNKLYVGSFGTLAVLTEITFKLRPLPEMDSTVLVRSKYRGPLFLFAKKLMASELQPASVILTNRLSQDSVPEPGGDNALVVRFMESRAAVSHQVSWAIENAGSDCHAREMSVAESEDIWARVADWHLLANNAVRMSVPLSTVAVKVEECLQTPFGSVATADIGTGIIRMAFEAEDDSAIKTIERLRASAGMVGGSVVIERASSFVKQRADSWGDVGPTANLMRSIKARFDPESILNPGRFVAGI
jgi:glycolate oxidase FAD binding subunit